ncbi:MAG TPA: SDR family oxidoreductase [Candidatus Limnocylindria bacterium]|nr:SDR family oxidoreductase [Candidatus Limnocylindria bacterium]
MDLGLTGKSVLVAAASKGLGRASAELFAAEGARVAICSREEAAITRAAEEIARVTGSRTVLPITADLSTKEGCETFVQTALGAYGAIDVLVVNAGGPPPGRFDDLDDGAWDKAFELTLMSAVRLTRLALPQMRKQRSGSIVYSTSTSVRQPTQYLALILSNALRASVHGMAKTLSSDLAKDGIRVNAVQPGRIMTDRIVQIDTDTAKREGTTIEAVRKRFEETVIPLRRYGRPDEFAAAVVFLASPRASYITGVSLQVDGGMLQSMF